MVRLLAATPLLVLGLVALGGCVTYAERPLYAGYPAYYDPYGPGYYGQHYVPRSYSGFSLSLGRGRHHHHGHGHHHHRHRHRHWW